MGKEAKEVLDEWVECAPNLCQISWKDTEGTNRFELARFINQSRFGATHFAYAFAWGKDANLPLRINRHLTLGDYILPLVWIKSGKSDSAVGGWVGVGGDNVDHWVVITGMSRQWRLGEEGSIWNWLRVYNPFTNMTEYYGWDKIASDSGTQKGFKGAWIRGNEGDPDPYLGLIVGRRGSEGDFWRVDYEN